MNRIFKPAVLAFILLALSACGGGAGSTGFTPGYTIGGTISGLISGRTLVLQNNLGDDLTRTASGAFTFATRLQPNTTYNVTILTQPAGENCVVTSGGSGTATADVTNVVVTCTALPYSVSGTITWNATAAAGLTLQNNGGDTWTDAGPGSTTFTFATQVLSGNPYVVTVSGQPTGMTCTVTNDQGTVVTTVTNVAVSCDTTPPPCTTCTIGGTLTGLQDGQSITFSNGVDSITKTDAVGNGAFTFPTGLASGTYPVSITSSPANQPCSVTYGAGIVTNANITNVNIFCGYLPRGSFVSAVSMAVARNQHTATRITAGGAATGTAANKVLVVGGQDSSGVATGSAELYDSTGSTKVTVATLSTPRYLHTATALTDGSVLVVGGIDGTNALSSAYRYYPSTNLWVTAGSLTVARFGHSATLLTTGSSAGKVLVVGGTDGTTGLVTAQLYNPTTNTWSTAGSLNGAHYNHAATLLSDGRVLVMGGRDATGTIIKTVEYYDPAVDTWYPDTAMTGERTLPTATLLSGGQVLIAGGYFGAPLNTAEVYTPGVTTGTWAAAGNMANARNGHTATILANGKVLVAGGCSSISCDSTTLATAELYDPATNAWSRVGDLTDGRVGHEAVLLVGGKVLVTGGYSIIASVGQTFATAELYDPALIGWSSTGNLVTARYRHTSTRLSGGIVLVAGGWSGSTTLQSSEYYDPALGIWTAAGSLATPRYDHAAVVLTTGTNAGKVLVIGGVNNTTPLASVEMYDPVGKTWSTLPASLKTARYQHTATVLFDGRILVAGGTDGSSTFTTAEIYDPAVTTPAWEYVGSLAAGRYQHTATLLNSGKVLVAGGASGGTAILSAEVFDPVPTAGGVYVWTTVGPMPTAHTQHTATLLPDGTVLVAGGMSGTSTKVKTSAIFTPGADTWAATTGNLTGARTLHSATLLPGGKVLVAGGLNTSALATAELYDTTLGTWSAADDLLSARYQHVATLLENGQLLVTGGFGTTTLNSAELGW